MKIALVLDRFDRRLGGVEQWTAQLADGLLSRGYELHVVARKIAERELRSGLTTHPLPALSSRMKLADAAAARLRSLDVDVIHDMGFGWYCDLLQPHGGSRTAATIQNLNLSPAWARPAKRLATALLPRYREFAALCDKQYAQPPADRPWRLVLAISEMVAADLKRHHGLCESEIRLVYNGVDTNRFSPALQKQHRDRIRTSLGIASDETTYLIVAHNFELKGVPALLKAMTLLKSAGQNATLVVVGGKRTSSYERMATRLGVDQHVRMIGPVDESAPFYAAADVYTQPTWYDPCSLVVLEALACGLPVITSRFNGAGDFIEVGRTGDVLVDPGNVIELAAAMTRWATPEARASAAEAARSAMLANTLDRNVEAIIAIYDEILSLRRDRKRRAA